MNKIKFSHEYCKMPECCKLRLNPKAKLIQLFTTDSDNLSKSFIYYDTEKTRGENYLLPKGKLIVLLLLTYDKTIEDFVLWTTIRRWTPKKEKYYRSKIGEEFEIEIKED